MALIPIYHVVASTKTVAAGQTIQMGQVVSLNAAGSVILQTVGTGGAIPAQTKIPFGLAGDTKTTTAESYMPGVVTASGWQNRVSDYFDETKASGKMTVYHSGGEFATDMYNTNVSSGGVVGMPLYGSVGYLDTFDTNTTGVIVARLTKLPAAYPSGVPGTDVTPQNDMALASRFGIPNDSYIEIRLVI
jgi:hypothetical protein